MRSQRWGTPTALLYLYTISCCLKFILYSLSLSLSSAFFYSSLSFLSLCHCVCVCMRCVSQSPRQMMTPVRLLPSTQSGQTSKYTTSVSDSELLKVSNCQMPVNIWLWLQSLFGVWIIVGKEPSICYYSMVGKRHSTGHSWLMSKTVIFCS